MSSLDQTMPLTDDQSELTMSVLMTPDMANFLETCMVEPF